METDAKDPAKVGVASNEAKQQQDIPEKNNLVKRDLQLSRNIENLHNKLADSGKSVGILRNDNIVVSQKSGNHTNLQEQKVNSQVNKDLNSETKEYSLHERTSLANHSKPVAEGSPKVEESIKIRDLKSNVKRKVKQPSSLSSRSIKSFISKQRSKRSRRSKLQVIYDNLFSVWFKFTKLTN